MVNLSLPKPRRPPADEKFPAVFPVNEQEASEIFSPYVHNPAAAKFLVPQVLARSISYTWQLIKEPV